MPGTLRVVSFTGDVNVVGRVTLSPSPTGSVDLLSAGSINGVQVNDFDPSTNTDIWGSSLINLSDANPASIPGLTNAQAFAASADATNWLFTSTTPLALQTVFNESGSTTGDFAVLQTKQALHAAGPLHAADLNPVHLYARNGDISGTTLFAGKFSNVVAGRDITDASFYIQNTRPTDISVVSSGRDLTLYDPNSLLRTVAQTGANELIPFTTGITTPASGSPSAGDIQISGPGTLEVLAGRNLTLGVGPNNPDGTAIGITSIGNARNPNLPFGGANVIAAAGISGAPDLSGATTADFGSFIGQFLDPTSASAQSTRYLPELGKLLGLTNASNADIWTKFQQLPIEQQDALALDIFYLVLRDAGRDHNDPSNADFGKYDNGFAAVKALFPNSSGSVGDISITSREIKTANGGDISLLAPGGQVTVGLPVAGTQAADQGILTAHGGNINIFTNGNVNVGTSRIFTLRGGNEIIWSTTGNIAAGSSSKTIQAAPPTRVLVDPQSGDVQTDLAGLATGGGIGVLETVTGVAPADTIDAGDAGIRVSGNLNLAALVVINATNIQVGGTSIGVPTVAAPNIGSLTAASNTVAASSNAAQQLAQNNTAPAAQEEVPSIISVEVLGYGGGDSPEDEEDKRRKKQQQQENQSSRDVEGIRVSSSIRQHGGPASF
jgi:hypothetical protein